MRGGGGGFGALQSGDVQARRAGGDARVETLNMKWVQHMRGTGEGGDGVWPVRVAGDVVGCMGEVAAVAVQENDVDGLVVWAFGRGGEARAWQLDRGRGEGVVHLVADRGGVLREVGAL